MFLILDCWDNFEYFKLNPKGKELKPQFRLPVRLVGLRLDKIEKAIDSGTMTSPNGKSSNCASRLPNCPKLGGHQRGGHWLCSVLKKKISGSPSLMKSWNFCAPKSSRCFARFRKLISRPCVLREICWNTRWPL